MNKFLFSILAGLTLIGCVVPVDESENEELIPTESVDSDFNHYRNNIDGPGYQCLPRSEFLIIPGNKTIEVLVPVFCDETPYIFKGDPVPDVVDRRGEKINTAATIHEEIKHIENIFLLK